MGDLDRATAVGFVDRGFHRPGHRVGIHDDLTIDMAGRPTDGLDQGAFRAQESFLVGIENRDERHLWQIKSFPQEVDADDDVVNAKPKIAQDLDPLECIDLAVEIVRANAHLLQVVRKVLRHPFGQRRHQHALASGDPGVDLSEQIVDLSFGRTDRDCRIDQARSAG